MKIICGTDFSQHSVEAADVAAAIAARLQEELLLVHVMESPPGEVLSESQLEELRGKHKKKLKQEAARLRESGAKVEEQLAEGSPSSVLTALAGKTHAGLVVVSSLGHIAPSGWLVGSVAERVAQSSPVPTLVVREGRALRAWAGQQKRALRIMVGCDFSASSDAALRWVCALRQIGPCQVTVASVSCPPQESSRFGLPGPSWPDNPPEVQKLLERDLRKHAEDILRGCDLEVRVTGTWGRPEPQLLDLAQAMEADLIVVGTHQRHGLERFWLGSVSRGLLHHAPMSVACVPPSGAPAGPGNIPLFQRVLVPTDFSNLGNHAVPFAYSTLYRGGTVALLHVREGGRSRQTARQAESQLKKLEQQLRALIPSEAEARWIASKVEVVEAERPAVAICQAAARFGADLICMGSHGRSGLTQTILGSVAQDVIAQSHIPVLVIRPPVA